MKVLGSVSARLLVHIGVIDMTVTIITCYIIAVSLGHVKPWLPTISACGDHAPEEFLFRFGIFIGAMLLEVEAWALYLSKKASGTTFALGAVAAFCLGVVAVVGANENDVLHTTNAVIFFVFEDIMLVLLTVDLLGRISYCSLGIKVVCCTVACASTIMRILLTNNLLTVGGFPALAVFEWSNTAAIILYQLSLSDELGSLALGILETDPSTSTTPPTPPSVIADKPLNSPPVYEVTGPSKKRIALAYLSSEKA